MNLFSCVEHEDSPEADRKGAQGAQVGARGAWAALRGVYEHTSTISIYSYLS